MHGASSSTADTTRRNRKESGKPTISEAMLCPHRSRLDGSSLETQKSVFLWSVGILYFRSLNFNGLRTVPSPSRGSRCKRADRSSRCRHILIPNASLPSRKTVTKIKLISSDTRSIVSRNRVAVTHDRFRHGWSGSMRSETR